MVKISILILLIFNSLTGNSQDFSVGTRREIDSLKRLLPGTETHEQVKILNSIAYLFAPVNFDSSIVFASQAIRLASTRTGQADVATVKLTIGNAYYYRMDFKNALLSYLSAQPVLEENFKYDKLGELCLMLGYINFFITRNDVAILYYNKAADYFKLAGDESFKAEVLYALTLTYWREGPVDSALVAGNRLLEYARKHNDRFLEASALVNMGMTAWDEKTLPNNLEALKIAKEIENNKLVAIIYNNIACYYYEPPAPFPEKIDGLDSARHYYNLSIKAAINSNYDNLLAMIFVGLTGIDIDEGRFDQAQLHLDSCQRILEDLASFPVEQPSSEGFYAFEKIFESFLALRTKSELYSSRFELAKKTGRLDDAIKYQQLYYESKENLRTAQQGRQLELLIAEAETEKTEQKIRMLSQDSELNQLRLSRTRYIFAGAAAGVLIFSLFMLLVFQRKRLRAEQKSIIMEQRLLRAQMNPHFLFNSLASIQNYIINEKTDQASIYLSRFSQLVRNILDNSLEEYVPLEKEIETVKNYLELQKVRYSGKFDFQIEVDEDIDEENIMIPPMLAQPFIENSIEHGVKYRETPGNIQVRFCLEEELIRVEVEDDGVGRTKAHEIEMNRKIKHRSMATSITHDRLKLINKKLKRKIHMEIIDLKDASGAARGTMVRFGIPIVIK
jgi:tetratricopeptide (TPR) repeat protein